MAQKWLGKICRDRQIRSCRSIASRRPAPTNAVPFQLVRRAQRPGMRLAWRRPIMQSWEWRHRALTFRVQGENVVHRIRSTRLFQVACAALVALASSTFAANATSRIKDLANIEGVRQNQLIGYGLVVGLNGTGDTLNNIPFTKQSLQAMLERMGVNIRGATIRTGNVAAVMVTGNLPAFATQGTRMDVTVSALGG